MIRDCYEGRIDLVVTKSVSRFARNLVDCIDHVRRLKALSPPVGIFFETERIYTLNGDSEMSLAFIATMAQEESHTKSAIMNTSIEMRFAHGIFLTPPLLGYDNDENGDLVVNEEEAKTVRLIFFMYLYGYTCTQIAEQLMSLGRKTKKGNTVWSNGSVLGIMQYERYCGDVLARKTFTPNYLDHKSKKNRGDRNQYLQHNHHEAIISIDDFIAVQRLISNAKYGSKGFLPQLQVITSGVLKGFVIVHPRWASFRSSDYAAASSCYADENEPEDMTISAKEGEIDFRGFEVARAQFFDTSRRICLTFSSQELCFSSECLKKLGNTLFVEFLIHPEKRLLGVRSCQPKTRTSIRWGRKKEGALMPRTIHGRAFLPTLYDILGWNSDYRYRIQGIRRQYLSEDMLLFDLDETEVFLPEQSLFSEGSEIPAIKKTKASVLAFPSPWADTFGNEYYRQVQKDEVYLLIHGKADQASEETESYQPDDSLNVTDREHLEEEILAIVREIR